SKRSRTCCISWKKARLGSCSIRPAGPSISFAIAVRAATEPRKLPRASRRNRLRCLYRAIPILLRPGAGAMQVQEGDDERLRGGVQHRRLRTPELATHHQGDQDSPEQTRLGKCRVFADLIHGMLQRVGNGWLLA